MLHLCATLNRQGFPGETSCPRTVILSQPSQQAVHSEHALAAFDRSGCI